MGEKRINAIELPAAEEHFDEAQRFLRQKMRAEGISEEIIGETMLVVEALFHNLLAQGVGSGTILQLSCRRSLGNMVIRIGYEGKIAHLFTDEEDGNSLENRILSAYEEKIGSSYRSGYNSFQITVSRKYLRSLLYCGVGLLCAFLVYLPIYFLVPTPDQLNGATYFLEPLEQLFGNAALMISAPVTFFSLVRNLTNTYILAERDSGIREIRGKAMASSLIIILLSIGMGFLLFPRLAAQMEPVASEAKAGGIKVFVDTISNAIPPSIFEPFETVSPIPLIFVALIVTFAFCSADKYFTKLKEAVDIFYTVFSRMLGLVLFAFPFIFFVTSLEILMMQRLDVLRYMIQAILLMLGSCAVVAGFYLIRLKLDGVRIGPFLKKLPPLMMENCRINSSIDAVPYNIRYCVRNYGMNRRRLERSLPILAQINFDGNCFLLMSVSMFLLFTSGKEIAWFDLLASALLVFFLSLGAPNQPGSILIGTMIILNYQGLEGVTYIFVAIFFEAGLGIVQNLINVVGDIVTVTIEEQQMKRVQ